VSESGLEILDFHGPEILGKRESIARFLLSLREERYSFALEEEDLARSKRMLIAIDDDGNWIALVGWRQRWWGGVFFLVVHRDHQRQGLGKRLTHELVERVPKGMLLLLSVDRSNTRARKLYTDAGFATLKRGKQHAFMALRNTAFFWLGAPLRIGFLLRSLWNQG